MSALLAAAFSPAIISVGQTLAMTLFLLRGDEAVRRHPGRLRLMPLLFLGGTISQMGLRMTIDRSLPVSTKADKANHGYGLRNIRYVVGRYGGEISCRVSGEEFVLTLLFLRESGAAND